MLSNQTGKIFLAIITVIHMALSGPVWAKEPNPPFASGRFIVKFKSEGPHALEHSAEFLLDKRLRFRDVLADGSDSLDLLNGKYGVRKARGLFITRGDLTTREARDEEMRARGKVLPRFKKRLQRVDERRLPVLSNIFVFEVARDADIEAICRDYSQDPHVEYAQPDYVFTLDFTPNDPKFIDGTLWGLKKIEADRAWDISQGEGIVVAVNDSGVDYNHYDLKDNIWSNPGEIAGNGIDDDKNGFVDDVRGWDFGNNDNDPNDLVSHGTHVAGIVAALGNNQIGVVGVAPGARIMAIKGASDTGIVMSSTMAAGIKYAAMNGADVINNSWGCLSRCPSDSVVEDAVKTAYGMGVVVVFSAGNQTDNVMYYSPANIAETIVVTAVDSQDIPWSTANYGNKIDVAAPGANIYSTTPMNRFSQFSGTSMAAPHVSGLAALMLAANPNLTHEEIRRIIRSKAVDIGAAGFDQYTGYGRINAFQSVNAVKPLNLPPILGALKDMTFYAGQRISLTVSASDPEGGRVALSAELSGGVPLSQVGATFVDNGNGTGTFKWTAVGGSVFVAFRATDGAGLVDVAKVLITVLQPPALDRATMVSPVSGGIISSSQAVFQWKGVSNTSLYWLSVGTKPGGYDIHTDSYTSSSTVVSSLPLDGSTIYARLWSKVNNNWLYNDYFYETLSMVTAKAVMLSPTTDVILYSPRVTFQWSKVSGVTEYWLDLGTAEGKFDIHAQGYGATSATVTSIPLNGQPVYARLWTRIGTGWQYNDYIYRTRLVMKDPLKR